MDNIEKCQVCLQAFSDDFILAPEKYVSHRATKIINTVLLKKKKKESLNLT